MAANKQKLELKFEHERDTKNKRRFQEVTTGEDEPVVGTLYVSKEASESLGDKLTITVEAG